MRHGTGAHVGALTRMRYHSHPVDDIDVHDRRGTVLAGEAEARVFAGEMVAHVARAKRAEKNPKFIQVTDNAGVELFRVAVPTEKSGSSAAMPHGDEARRKV